jgi:hypothetical protein
MATGWLSICSYSSNVDTIVCYAPISCDTKFISLAFPIEYHVGRGFTPLRYAYVQLSVQSRSSILRALPVLADYAIIY